MSSQSIAILLKIVAQVNFQINWSIMRLYQGFFKNQLIEKPLGLRASVGDAVRGGHTFSK